MTSSSYVAERMNSVEINGSFYSLQRRSSFEAWAAAVPEDFVFAVKGGRFITHMKKLNDIATPLANFFASGVLGLDRKLGPLLWQLPPNLGFDVARMDAFLANCRGPPVRPQRSPLHHDQRVSDDRALMKAAHPRQRLRHAVEVRHESFRSKEFYELLRHHKIALVIADNPGQWPIIDEPTTDFRYVRLHGHDQLYASGYSDRELDQWAAKITSWTEQRLRRLRLLRQRHEGACAVRRDGSDGPPRRRTGASLTADRVSPITRFARREGRTYHRTQRSPAYPKELTYPCCRQALGELGEVSPREGPGTSVRDPWTDRFEPSAKSIVIRSAAEETHTCRDEAIGSRPEVCRRIERSCTLLVNTLIVSVINFTVWFAITFWVLL